MKIELNHFRESTLKYCKDLNTEISSGQYLYFKNKQKDFKYSFRIRKQFENFLSLDSIRVRLNKVENTFLELISKEFRNFYSDEIYFTRKRFYHRDYDFNFQEIKSEAHLEEYVNEFVKCIEFHEKEVFPKLLDIHFLAEYVGSVPFERKGEISVGGNFPVHLFKKMAILKWGEQEERYQEYKNGTQDLIHKYAIKKPEKYIPEFQTGFEKLVHHLENEPNPT